MSSSTYLQPILLEVGRKGGCGEFSRNQFPDPHFKATTIPPPPLPPPKIVLPDTCLRYVGFPSHLSFHSCSSTSTKKGQTWYITLACKDLWDSRDGVQCEILELVLKRWTSKVPFTSQVVSRSFALNKIRGRLIGKTFKELSAIVKVPSINTYLFSMNLPSQFLGVALE